jgi:parallel beta-helix repeat protein
MPIVSLPWRRWLRRTFAITPISLPRLLHRTDRAARRAASPRARLVLHGLEDRAVPATFTVTNTGDSATGSLRQVISSANGSPQADTIVFNTDPTAGTDFSQPQTITLSFGQIAITRPLTIVGPGADKLTITANNVDGQRVFNIDNNAASPISVTLSGMRITGGRITNGDGGGIFIRNENVTILDSVITGNTVSGNAANAYGSGGGIALDKNGGLTVRNSTISGNSASGSGGGIYFYRNGSLLLENSTVSGNAQATDPLGGGGVYFRGAVTPLGFSIRNSTISGNTAVNGGGVLLVDFAGNARIQNSTITNNTATAGSSSAGDAGGGIAKVSGSGAITLVSSIVAGNRAPSAATNRTDVSVGGTGQVTAVFSAIGVDPGPSAFASESGWNLPFGADLKLQPLANNGGPTQTHALGTGSAAIDRGANLANLGTDQRGTGFARVVGLPDIGAVESGTLGTPVE